MTTSQILTSRSFLVLTVLGLFLPWVAREQSLVAGEPKQPASKPSSLGDSLKVTLSSPVLVARSKGYLWFPNLVRREDGTLLARMYDYADVHTNQSTGKVCWSSDGGQTWSELQAALGSDSHVSLPGGDLLLLPYYLYPRKDGLGAPYQRVPRGKRELQTHKDGILVTDWPRPDRSFAPQLGLAGFVFNGQTVSLKNGSFLGTLYGYFKDTKRYSLVAAQSKDGVRWTIRSIVADDRCALPGGEGPCEAALCRLKDGRLLCVFRMNSGAKYGQVWSSDEGKTWTQPRAMKEAFSVQPSLAVLKDGMLVISGGRPGLFAWFNPEGTGRDWQSLDIRAHHNAYVPKEPILRNDQTSSYTEVVAVGDNELVYIYDRIPFGWGKIPRESTETNSVWVIRLTCSPPDKRSGAASRPDL
jgi:hypothetical protein